MSSHTDVAAIYFPSWHSDPRRDAWMGAGWTEWQLVQAGRPRFDGHAQPIVPALGYLDESIPANMQASCDLASGAGIDAFLWDWYWYDGDDFLNRPLNETFLSLPEPGIAFALMWANHDWTNVFPDRLGRDRDLWWPGRISLEEFTRMTTVIIERYFLNEHYWRVDGAAWFTVFRLDELVAGVGGVDVATEAIADFRNRARAAGAGEIHIDVMGGYDTIDAATIRALGVDTVGTYGWGDQLPTDQGLTVQYHDWRTEAERRWAVAAADSLVDFVPSVAMGWDATTRIDQRDAFVVDDWPHWPVVVQNTPEEFAAAITAALDFVESRDGTRVVTVNAWNEWTEGSYLEPDTRTGDAHLRALGAVLRSRRTPLS